MVKRYFILLIFISVLALGSVYVAEFFFNILPCPLCLYQRYIYFAILAISVVYFSLNINELFLVSLSFVMLLLGFVIAFFHSGVERKWFKYESLCAGFSTPIDSMQDMINSIESSQIARCDILEPQILSLTMANLNAVLLASLCTLAIYVLFKKSSRQLQY